MIRPVIEARMTAASTAKWPTLASIVAFPAPLNCRRVESAVGPTSDEHRCYLKLTASAYHPSRGAIDIEPLIIRTPPNLYSLVIKPS
jgi:hypothetical protein